MGEVPAVPAVPASSTPTRHVEPPTAAQFCAPTWLGPTARRPPEADPLPWLEKLLRAVGSACVSRKWQCPAHATIGEHSTSLRLARGDGGRLLLFCHAGCDYRDILRALRLTPGALTWAPPTDPAVHARFYLRRLRFPEPKSGGGSLGQRGFTFEVDHPYGDPPLAWKERYRHPTTGEKEIRWESVNPKGERVPGLLGRRQADLPLYRERDVKMAISAREPVLLVESESSVDALIKAGLYATTWAGGAADPPLDRLAEVFAEYAGLVIVPDNDTAGLTCLAKLRSRFTTARELIPGEGEDARDLLARVGAREFMKLVSAP